MQDEGGEDHHPAVRGLAARSVSSRHGSPTVSHSRLRTKLRQGARDFRDRRLRGSVGLLGARASSPHGPPRGLEARAPGKPLFFLYLSPCSLPVHAGWKPALPGNLYSSFPFALLPPGPCGLEARAPGKPLFFLSFRLAPSRSMRAASPRSRESGRPNLSFMRSQDCISMKCSLGDVPFGRVAGARRFPSGHPLAPAHGHCFHRRRAVRPGGALSAARSASSGRSRRGRWTGAGEGGRG